MEEKKRRIHPKIISTLKSLGEILVLCIVVFFIAAIRQLADIDIKDTTSKQTTTKSLIDSFIPTTESPNIKAIQEVSSILSHAIDTNFVEDELNYYNFNRYTRTLSYNYYEGINAKIYRYENKTIIYLNDNSGIIKLFIFNTNNTELINSIKTVVPIDDTYNNSFTVIDGEIYYINSNTYREDTCLIVNSPLEVNKYDLTTEKDSVFKSYEDTTEIKINCA